MELSRSAGGGRSPARGLTLVELLMAVALVAVLMALAYPAYQSHRDRVRTAQAVKDIAMMSAVIEAYRTEFRAYPPDLSAVRFNTRTDPWGRPYRYHNVEADGRGGARKDRALNPINSDFDLFSVGPDGDTHVQVSNRLSADDVIRGNNGRFVGRGADF